MQKLLFLLTILSAAFAFRSAPIRYTADAGASHLAWTGHAEVGTWAPAGTLQLQRGTATATGTTLQTARFAFDLRTITHENADLQSHLRGEDFFDVAHFPTATFELRAVRDGNATGDLTIKGVRHAISFPLAVTATSTGLRVRGTATIDRTQFGIRYNSTSFFADLGDYAIRNTFELAFDIMLMPASQSR